MKYVLICVLFVSTLMADRDGGPYLGLSYGNTQYYDDDLFDDLSENITKSIGIYGGAYINKHLSVELNYVDFSSYSGVNNGQYQKLSFYVVTVATLAHYPFYDDMFDVYVKFGVGDIRERELAIKGFTFLYGMGISLRINELISVKLAYDVYPFGYDTDGDNVSDFNQNINYIHTALEFQF